MNRVVVSAISVMSVLAMSSCSVLPDKQAPVTIAETVNAENASEAPSSDSPIAASEPASVEADAFHFESGSLKIGPFDPEEVYPDVFDPCKEISREEFATLGFTITGNTTSLGGGTALFCSLIPKNLSDPLTYSVGGNLVTEQDFLEKTQDLRPAGSTIVPDAVIYSTPADNWSNCRAAVETERGSLQTRVGIYREDPAITYDLLCAEAVHLLESLKGI